MAEQAPPDDDKLPDAEAKERFDRLVGNLVNTPHKPHKGDGSKRRDRLSLKNGKP
jgi:hypothetical protein